MKFNPLYLLGGLFVLAIAALGALLLRPFGSDPRVLQPGSDAARFTQADRAKPATLPAPAAPAAPKDERFVIKRILPITGPIKYGKWHWDEKNVPAGPVVITVDLDARVLSVFRAGYEIGATAVLLGTSETPTPLGVFPVKWKRADHYSSIYDQAQCRSQ